MYIEGAGTCKTNRNEQGGEGVKNWKFWVNILFDCPQSETVLKSWIEQSNCSIDPTYGISVLIAQRNSEIFMCWGMSLFIQSMHWVTPHVGNCNKWQCNILKQSLSQVHCTKKVRFPADLVTFTEQILNGKLHFLCSGC